MRPYRSNVTEYFSVQNKVVIYHKMSHTCVILIILIQQILMHCLSHLNFLSFKSITVTFFIGFMDSVDG